MWGRGINTDIHPRRYAPGGRLLCLWSMKHGTQRVMLSIMLYVFALKILFLFHCDLELWPFDLQILNFLSLSQAVSML